MSHHNNKKHCKKDCPKRCPPKCEPKCAPKCEVIDKWSCSSESCDEPKRMKQVTVITKYKNTQCKRNRVAWGSTTRKVHDWECDEPCERKYEKKNCHGKKHH